VTEVVIGQALSAGQGQNPARQASVAAGIPYSVPAYGVNMLCGSGLKAVALGYQAVLADENAVIVAGGQESMTQCPHYSNLRVPTKMGDVTMVDSLLSDGLTDAFYSIHMGVTGKTI